jgi:hemin uptake protein HemP
VPKIDKSGDGSAQTTDAGCDAHGRRAAQNATLKASGYGSPIRSLQSRRLVQGLDRILAEHHAADCNAEAGNIARRRSAGG